MENIEDNIDDIFSSRENPYIVDRDYLEAFSGLILDKLSISSHSIADGYTVEEVYFDTLPLAVLSKVQNVIAEDAITEIKAFAPTLSTLSRNNSYLVPSGYFESFNPHNVPVVAKVITLPTKKKLHNKWWKYAAAAVVLLITSTSSIYILKQKETKEIYSYYNNMNIDSKVSELADSDIINYLGEDSEESFWRHSSNNDKIATIQATIGLSRSSDAELEEFYKNATYE